MRRRVDDVLVNTGLAYLLSFASRAPIAGDVVEGSTCIRRWRRSLACCKPTRTQVIATLARAAHLSSSH